MNYQCGCYTCQFWNSYCISFYAVNGIPCIVDFKALHEPFSIPKIEHQSENEKPSSLSNSVEKETADKPVKVEDVEQLLDPKPTVKKTKTKKIRTQKNGRNIVSNIIRSFYNFCKTSDGQEILDRINKNTGAQISMSYIFRLFDMVGVVPRCYIKISQIVQIIDTEKSDENRPQKKVFSSLFKIYLEQYARAHFLTSRKINIQTVPNILKQIRNIYQVFYKETGSKIVNDCQ